MLKFNTEKRKINDLIPYEHNPRQMTEKQVEDLRKSLEKFDLAEIPVINTDNTIIAGHQRLKILQTLGRGEEEIDVRVPNRELTDEEVQEYNIRSNKNMGSWDWDILYNTFNADLLEEWGFTKPELMGFMPDIDVDEHWKDMPAYKEGEIKPFKTLYVHFMDEEAMNEFATIIGQKLTKDTKYIYHPAQERRDRTAEVVVLDE